MTAFALLLALVAQFANTPEYLRPDADIEHRAITVELIHDGDTFRGEDGLDYRLAGINAPEVAHPEHGKPDGEPGGKESAEFLHALLAGRRVTALIDRANSTDRYGRTVALILADDVDVNLEMLRSGHAEPRYIDLSPMIDPALFLAAVQPEGSRPAATSEDVTVAGHVLAPGDKIRIVVGNQTQDFTINPDGEILIKGLGIFSVGGRTSIGASAELDSAIRAKGISIQPITVFFVAPPARQLRNVVVLGAVRKPGTYEAATLLAAVSSAEGFTDAAYMAEVRVIARDTAMTVNAARILASLDPDPPLQGGEIVLVQALPRILVSGAVAKPNWVSALTISEAISAAGGPIPEADLEHVEYRSQTDAPIRLDAQAIFSGKSDDIRLSDRERITVPIRPRAIPPLVQVYGPVQRPGTTEAFTIADAIRESRPDTTADLATVIIDRAAGESESVNARDIALGHALDQDLKEGDRILIPRRPEAAPETPQTVTVLGDVAKPGQYPPGTLTQVLAAASGPTNTARTTSIRVRLPDGQARIYDLTRITTGKQLDPYLAVNSTVLVESDEPRRQSMNDLRTFIGVLSTLVLLGLRLSL